MTEVNSFVAPEKMRADIEIDPHDLHRGFLEQAGLYSYYAELAARAGRQYDQMRQRREIIEGQVARELREAAADEKRKITEKEIETSIQLDKRVMAARKAMYDAREVHEVLKGQCEAFRMRRDMLIQIGVAAREEAKGEAYVKAHQSVGDRAREMFQKGDSERDAA